MGKCFFFFLQLETYICNLAISPIDYNEIFIHRLWSKDKASVEVKQEVWGLTLLSKPLMGKWKGKHMGIFVISELYLRIYTCKNVQLYVELWLPLSDENECLKEAAYSTRLSINLRAVREPFACPGAFIKDEVEMQTGMWKLNF